MAPAQDALVARVRSLLDDEFIVREVSMFGGCAVMVNQKMLVSALRNGNLLVRVDAARHDDLLRRSGAAGAEMGRGRAMGPGWIEVEAAAIASDAALAAWVDEALAYNRVVARHG